MILQADPGRSYFAIKEKIDLAVKRVLESAWYILGKENIAFEKSFAQYTGSNYCLGVANGTDAVEIILRALDIGNGDMVATVGNTAVATVAAIERTGAQARFADIEPHKFTMSASSLNDLLAKEKNIKAVIVVHLFGCPAEMKEICEVAAKYNIPVIEDCAQAHGAEYNGRKCGTIGIAGSFSFYPTKNLGAFGDGGAVVTDNRELFEKMTALRQYGWKKRYISEFTGINSRLDEMQAAVLSVKLPYLDENNQKRRSIAAQYRSALKDLSDIELPVEPETAFHVYHQFVLRVKNNRRVALADYLKKNDILTAIHYPLAIPRQPGYQEIPLTVSLTETFETNQEILSLPMYPELTEREIRTITDAIRDFL